MRLPGSEAQRRWALRAVVVLAAVGAYFAFTRLIDLEQVLEDVASALGAWTYLLVGCFAFAETGAFVGLVAPGETVMLLGGAVAGQGATGIYLTIAIAWVAACAGDTTSFLLGRRLGRDFLRRHGPRFGLSAERLDQIDDFFDRHGGQTIFLGRFVGLVRAFAPFIAGSSGMRYRAFLPYSVLGCGLWVSACVVVGYFFSRSIDAAIKYAGQGAVLLGTLIAVVVGAISLHRHFRVAANRRAAVAWLEGHRASRWIVTLGRRYRRQLRFLADRVTPGGSFGLEFTSLVAVLAVAVFVVVAYAVVVSGEPGPTPGDRTAADIAAHLRAGWLTAVAEPLTALGSGAFAWGLTAVCAALLAARRRWAEFGVLLAGMALASLCAYELKLAIARPRPPEPLVGFSGWSFPSGHATHSVLYLWLAVTIVLRLRPGMARGAVVVAAGIALTVLVGLSRVYLGVHYLSDVSGGWAVGAGCFALCTAVALVISQVRQNPRR